MYGGPRSPQSGRRCVNMGIRHLDLFSGIGGFALAASWVWGEEHETVSFCEIEPYAQKVLKKHWPDVPCHDDIKTLKGDSFGTVDIITGGFPCQPFSVAGKQGGSKDDRHLWPEMFRVIQEARPTWVIGENVAGIINMVEFEQCFINLESEGYETQAFIIPACAKDAKHRRDRVWAVAHSNSLRMERTGAEQQTAGVSRKGEDVANSDNQRLQRCEEAGNTKSKRKELRQLVAGQGQEYARWSVEPSVGLFTDGLPSWLYGHCGKGMSYENSQRITKELCGMWEGNVKKAFQWAFRGLNRMEKAEVLFIIMCEYKEGSGLSRKQLESKETLEKEVRDVFGRFSFIGTPQRLEQVKQYRKQHPDFVCDMPQQDTSWESDIARVELNIPSRVDRIKGLGNAIVPQVVVPIMQAIKEIYEAQEKDM